MIVDGHVHFDSTRHRDRMLSDMARTGAHQFCVLVIDRIDEDAPFKQVEAVWLKRQHPGRVFVFGGLDFTGVREQGVPLVPFVEQLERLRSMGFDGVKSLSGKPTFRHKLGHRLDSDVFTPLLRWLEESQFPFLWHVNDPPEFWNEHAVPRWAREKGWWYERGVPGHEQIETEIREVLARHQNLNLILPHFFFLSNRLEDAAELLQMYPKICLDLAPGIEMLHHFTQNRSKAREFFCTFADRILFGTDIGMLDQTTSPDRGVMIRRFLETEDTFPVPEDPAMTPDDRPQLQGLKLPLNVTRQILGSNFHRVVGRETPRDLQEDALRAFLPASFD